MVDASAEPIIRRRPGRPPRSEAAAKPTRERRAGRIEVEGRDGTVLARRRTGNIDPYAVPQHIIPDGWDYQWNPHTVYGKPEVDGERLMAENGWRPVPSERHPGVFNDESYKGPVIRGGLRLEERPMALTMEARQEENDKAFGQVRDQNAHLFGESKFGRGFENRSFNGRSRAQGEGVRQGVEVAADAPRPRLEIDPN